MDILDIIKDLNQPKKEAEEPVNTPTSEVEEMALGLEKLAESYLSPKSDVKPKEEDIQKEASVDKKDIPKESTEQANKAEVSVDDVREELINRILASKKGE